MLEFHQTSLANRLLALLQLVKVTATRATVAEATAAMQLEDYSPIIAAM